MGVHGLWPLLEPTSISVTLDALEGKRLAVDISLWLYQAAQGFNSGEIGPDTKHPHLALLIRRIAKLLFYKIRPVFVFDGLEIPVFKRQVLRDRVLKKHLGEILVDNKDRKKMLEQLAKSSQDSEANSKKILAKTLIESPSKRKAVDEDLFVLPSTSHQHSHKLADEKEDSFNYLEGYDSLQTADARLNFLKDAKEKCRLTRLRDDEIPLDSREFSSFQLNRLLSRNKINAQLDLIRKDMLQQSVKMSDDKMKMVVVDNQLRSHILLQNEDVQTVDPERESREKLLRESLCWPEFLKQVDGHSSTKPKTESKSVNGNAQSADDDSDDGLQEAILASLAEKNQLSEREFKELPESGFRNALFEDNWSSSESENEFDKNDVTADKNGGLPHTSRLNPSLNSDVDYMSSGSSSLSDEEHYDQIELGAKRNDTEDYFRARYPAKNGQEIEDDNGIYAECQNLLALLGVPYLCAPGEAEAQCVELERLGLVDGIVSDDSDVWLFGANCVYKNMFSRSRHVQEYRSKKILEELGLSRSEFIQIGMLSGGDYSDGFQKIGVVMALEMIAEFLNTEDTKINRNTAIEHAIKPLDRIGKWLRAKNNLPQTKAKIRLRKIIEANNEFAFIERFPDNDVFNAYAKPNVNSSSQRFQWKRINFEKLDDFLFNKIGWMSEKLNELTHGAFKKWDNFIEQSSTLRYQTRMDAFVDKNVILNGDRLTPTNRVQMALAKLKDLKSMSIRESEENDDAEMDLQILQDATSSSKPKLAVPPKRAKTKTKAKLTNAKKTKK